MGTKKELAPTVARIVGTFPSGPCIDLFSGMCSVAGAISSSGRQVWCNDLQQYASLVAETLIASTAIPPKSDRIRKLFRQDYQSNMRRLETRWEEEITRERKVLDGESFRAFIRMTNDWKHSGNDHILAREASRLRKQPAAPYRLVTLNFAHGYFGLGQSNQIDSLRYAIDRSLQRGDLFSGEAKWCLVALLQTVNRLVTSTGHFAQFLHVRNGDTFRRIRSTRRRNGWDTFFAELNNVSPYGETNWRSRNRVFCDDAINLANALGRCSRKPSVVYADPPYSEAQYSRYYHVLETLVRYDYPKALSRGRYRDDRINTSFSRASSVHLAFEELIQGVSATGAALVLSYPSNGLLFSSGHNLFYLLSQHYRSASIVHRRHKAHSTFGASSGKATHDACEMIIVAKQPR